ncbi:MAG: DUF6279 family lipoprotein [Gammaproteobacteria bacterium]
MQAVQSPTGPGVARWVSRLRVLVTGLLVVVLLGGCVVRVVYNQLDWLALWYIEDYFDLDSAQEQQARQMIAKTLSWHRATQLPRYADLSRRILEGIGPPVDPRFLSDRYAEAVKLWDDLLVQVAPDSARLMQSLNDDQVEDLFANLDEENEDLAKDYSDVSPEKRRAKQDKAIIAAFRRFTGRLTYEQEALVRSRTAGFHDLSTDWLERRAVWQREFRALLAGRKSDPRFAERISGLVLEPNRFDSARYRNLVLENQQASFELVAAVLGSLSPKQAGHLREHVTNYAEDFEALVRGNPDPARKQ